MENIPTLWPDCRWLWNAWETLSNRRVRTENGPQAIAMAEILAFVTYERIEETAERDELLSVIRTLDALYITDAYEKIAKKRREAAKKRGKGKRQ